LDALSDLPGLQCPVVAKGAEPVWHLFVVGHQKRDALQQSLADVGISTLIHYPVPPHLSGAYAEAGYKKGAFPLAESLAKSVLSLPMGPHLSSAQVTTVVDRLSAFCCGTLRS
jgi:dTDP-3-amino-3,4,6-trideoxy-alpha-D-glucose transaminase